MLGFDEQVQEVKRLLLLEYLEDAGWNIAKAASAARKNRTDFYKLMKKTGIKRPRRVMEDLRARIERDRLDREKKHWNRPPRIPVAPLGVRLE
jgi:hypothetical protein